MNRKLGKAGKAVIVFGAVIVALLAYIIAAGLYSDAGGKVTIVPFFDNIKVLMSDMSLLFNTKYINGNLAVSLFILELIYALVLIYWLFGPNKFIRGREYGTAEWADASDINKQMASFNPEDRYKYFYVKERKHKKLIRKLFERKKDYIK